MKFKVTTKLREGIKDIEGRCSTKLRIAILQDEIALWEKRCDTEPRSNLYYGYIRDMMTNRVKELKDIENIG